MATSKKKAAKKTATKGVKKAAPRKKSAAPKKAAKKTSPKKAAKKKTMPAKKAAKKAAGKKSAVKKAAPKKKAAAKKKTAFKKAAPAKKAATKKKASSKKSVKRSSTAVEAPMAPQVEEQTIPSAGGEHDTISPVPAVDLHEQAKAMQKNDPRQHLQYSPKSKGSIKPSGKKPLWN
jgi:hypothetical protein